MTSEVQLPDPDDLTDEQNDLLDDLIDAEEEKDHKTFDRLMDDYIRRPAGKQAVFRHPEVVEASVRSLDRLIAKTQMVLRGVTDKERRREISDHIQLYTAERKAIRPFLNLALAEAARNSSRGRAARILARVLYSTHTKPLIDALDAGMTEKAAEAMLRERLKTMSG